MARLPDGRLLALFDALAELPERDLALLVELPAVTSPELARAYRAIAADDVDVAAPLLHDLLRQVDTPQARAPLAGAVAELRDAGRIDRPLAAATHIDLDGGTNVLITASLVHAAALAAGVGRAPGGLMLAA